MRALPSTTIATTAILPKLCTVLTTALRLVTSLDRDEEEGEQDIWYFASTGDLAQVGSLLAEGQFTLDQPDEDGRTPLMWAADKGAPLSTWPLRKNGQKKKLMFGVSRTRRCRG